jgi:hypothetical protein
VVFGFSAKNAAVTYNRRNTRLYELLESLVRSTRYSRIGDDRSKLSVLEQLANGVLRSLHRARVRSRLFSKNYISETLDTLKSMHKTPLTEPSSGPGDGSEAERASRYIVIVCAEWGLVERVVASNSKALYVFHESVRFIKEECHMFAENPDVFLKKFTGVFAAAFARIEHTPPPDFNAERFVCALCSLSCCIEGALARMLETQPSFSKKTPIDFARRFYAKAHLGAVCLTDASLVVFLDSVENRTVVWNPTIGFRDSVKGLPWRDAAPMFHRILDQLSPATLK